MTSCGELSLDLRLFQCEDSPPTYRTTVTYAGAVGAVLGEERNIWECYKN